MNLVCHQCIIVIGLAVKAINVYVVLRAMELQALVAFLGIKTVATLPREAILVGIQLHALVQTA
jgi:hypothetical protein